MLVAIKSDIRQEEFEFFNNGEFCGTLAINSVTGGDATLTSGINAFRLTSELKFTETRYIMTPISPDGGSLPPVATASGGAFGCFIISYGDKQYDLGNLGTLSDRFVISGQLGVIGSIQPKGWTASKWEFDEKIDLDVTLLQFIFWLASISVDRTNSSYL